ncbi:MAG: HAMP domain-containing histidine kinase, partial [Acidobacteria bacterium]|nr:HAMP domain-containing histidine kinase [Acidobacteriota bacterium]
ADAKGQTLHYEAPPEHAVADADRDITLQVCDNLLANAVKYSPHGKSIWVRVRQMDGKVRIEVRDEGPGVSAADLKKMFGKFARLTARPTGGEHSTGLGLSIVKSMVEAMHGRVWCESQPGAGATFIVELPASLAETAAQVGKARSG